MVKLNKETVDKVLDYNKPVEEGKPSFNPINHPEHYISGSIECIDAMVSAFGVETVADFCLCNTFKYLWRHRKKNGIEDIQKASWYLSKYEKCFYALKENKI